MCWFIKSLLLLAIVAIPQYSLARDPVPPELRGAADMRSQIEAQVEAAARASSSVTGRDAVAGLGAPAATPEKEMERRRKLINDAHGDFVNIVGSQRAPIGIGAAESSTGGRNLGGLLGEPPSGGGRRGSSEAREPGVASTRSGDSGFEGALSTSSEKRFIPAPPRAIAVEGKIVVRGGEGGAIASSRNEKNLRYTVEEKFVGNLVVAEPIEAVVARGELTEDGVADARAGSDDFRGESSGSGGRTGGVPLSDIGKPRGGRRSGGRLTPADRVADAGSTGGRGGSGVEGASKSSLGREYQMDTLSTGVQVKAVQGGVCMEPGEGDGACARSASFSRFEVSSSNRYGQFNDGVVSAEMEGGKVKIDVEAPQVAFATAGGDVKASLNCTGAKFELSENEFRSLIDGGSIALTKDVGSKGTSCVEGSTITLNLTTKGK